MNSPNRLQLTFWGVRGSIPTPVPENLGYGGNTTCLELRLPNDEVVVIDGGTGVRQLGLALQKRSNRNVNGIHFLMTHFHWDHIQGIPFFAPLYSPANRVVFHSSRPAAEVLDILEGQMTFPYFPVKFELLAAKREFVQLAKEEPLCYGDLTVRSFPLNHPQGATGFRLESSGAVIVHACDHEHGDAQLDRVLRENAEGADVMIYDAQFTPEEYGVKKGWGHSTWLEGARVAKDAGVKQLILSHHDPSHTDDDLRAMLAEAQKEFPNTELARESWTIHL
ncbi:MAG: MBL fold metallo-hydrolase [Bryobacterales bacterium]|nr:MBL fold metallo-hydrolase [Bryobacterales bacterium]